MTAVGFEALLARVEAGQRLSTVELTALAGGADVLSLGMLADSLRRRLHGARVTFVRSARAPFEGNADAIGRSARDVRLTGTPGTLQAAVEAVARWRGALGSRSLTAWSSPEVRALASGSGVSLSRALAELRQAGLDGLAEVALDDADAPDDVVTDMVSAGFPLVRLGVRHPGADRHALFLKANALQERFGCVRVLDPLPSAVDAARPTTGYDDVKAVAVARLAAPDIPSIQVDWHRYGPKLAQVALAFGADDLDGVSASDDAPDGRRRAPLEEVRRNIEAAGFIPVERDGRFAVVA